MTPDPEVKGNRIIIRLDHTPARFYQIVYF
ncbi:MAG: hypothetical protein QG577_524, partial [Thermodesulfobacteriota bacterium]|nr:hypothetical protein [Thermodesulfobacteriota bacterium]